MIWLRCGRLPQVVERNAPRRRGHSSASLSCSSNASACAVRTSGDNRVSDVSTAALVFVRSHSPKRLYRFRLTPLHPLLEKPQLSRSYRHRPREKAQLLGRSVPIVVTSSHREITKKEQNKKKSNRLVPLPLISYHQAKIDTSPPVGAVKGGVDGFSLHWQRY